MELLYDSVSQSKSNTSSKLLECQIRLEQKCIELKAAYDLMEAQKPKACAGEIAIGGSKH